MIPQPFTPEIPPDRLEALHRRLADINWPTVIGDDDWRYGVPGAWMRDMASYWREEWQWSSVQSQMQAWPHYRIEINGIEVHYVYAAAADPQAPALILSHGWPWTFWDFKEVIGPLSRPEAYGGNADHAFNVVVPSLPGFGFSAPLTQSAVDVGHIAQLWVTLMTQVLGFRKFAAHGGDWGALITAQLSHAHAEHLHGAHMSLTLVPGVNRTQLPPDAYAEHEQWMVQRNAEAAPTITSHIAVHRLDPQTLSYALMDSPIGTAAWLWERRRNWSDCQGNVDNTFSREDLCTTAALYWCTGAITSSLRLYFEHFNKPWPLVHAHTPVLQAPSAYAVFPQDVVHLPRAVLESHVNLKRYTVMPRGGHFGAAEAPELLVSDVQSFFFEDLDLT